jgi:hypothetical protein
MNGLVLQRSRYVKQAYNLEDVRVRKIVAIKNTVALVMAVA